MEIPRHSVALIQPLYQQQLTAVRWDGEMSEWFEIGEDTRQGCNISRTYRVQHVCRRYSTKNLQGVVVRGRNINNLRYADDTTYALKHNKIAIRDALAKLAHESKVPNMSINIIDEADGGRKKRRQSEKLVGVDIIQHAEEFKFLGSI